MGRLLATTLVTCTPCVAWATPVPDVLDLSHPPDDAALSMLVWSWAPEALEARAVLAADASAVGQAGLLQNPALNLAVGTIPLGETNPPDPPLEPFSQVMNYGVELSETIEIGKRGHRIAAAEHALAATRLEAIELLRTLWFELVAIIQDVAAAELRVGAVEELLSGAERLAYVAGERARVGDAPPSDAERARLEAERLRANLADSRDRLAAALSDCARAAGVRCDPFGSTAAAAAFLARRFAGGEPSALPVLKALEARARAAREERALAAARALPDPTVSVGYLRDQFSSGGNQRNSMQVAVSLPLAVFDRGQFASRAAEAATESATARRDVLARRMARDAERLRARLVGLTARSELLRVQAVPLARSVVGQLEAAAARGAGNLTDLVLARRALGEVVLDGTQADADRAEADLALARVAGFVPPLPAALAAGARR